MYNLIDIDIMSTIKVNRNVLNEFILSILAGIVIGIGCIGLAFVKSDTPLFYSVSGLLGGFIFSFGLFSIFRLGFELFTGNCLMFASVLHGKIKVIDMLRVLGISLAGNVLGCVIVAMIFAPCGFSYMSMIEVMAKTKATTPPALMFFRAIMCNIVICIATIINKGAINTTSKFIAAFIATMIFVACGFEHSVADAFIMVAAFMVNTHLSVISMMLGIIIFIIVVIGNVVGGFALAGLYFGANCYDGNQYNDFED